MSKLVVLAYDPGETTGYAVWGYPEGEMSFGQAPWFDAATWSMTYVEALVEAYEVQLVSESFVITQRTLRTSRENWSLEFIGILRWLALRYTGNELVLQSPGNAKSFGSDARLNALGWRQKGRPHANDAARHLLLYLVNNGLLDPGQIYISG